MKYAAILLAILLVGCKAEPGIGSETPPTSSEAISPTVEVEVVINDNVITVTQNTPDAIVIKQEIQEGVKAPPELKAEVPIVEYIAPREEQLPEDFGKLPANAAKFLPVLREVAEYKWPSFPSPSIFAAQAEKESCVSLKHKNCWSPYSEFKTKREYGFGIGQITIAYDAAGKVRFNKFEELKLLDSDLKNWDFADRHNAYLQFIALVVLNQINYKALAHVKTKTETDKVAMMLAAYNGGLGGLTGELKMCKSTAGCDPERWFGNVEKTTRKSKVKPDGYGSSFADINRLYPFDILYTRRDKYLPFFNDRLDHPKLAKSPHKF